MKVCINDIVVPISRKRQVTEERVKELADSIKQLGLLQPIVITADGQAEFGLIHHVGGFTTGS